MTPIEIVLLIIGALVIILSCFIIDKSGKEKVASSDLSDLNGENLLTEDLKTIKDIKDIKDRIDMILSEVTEDTVQNTENHLSQISNEKIIAVNDYSNQVLEKISQNHEEVVFLYNMLNEKESEIKELLRQMESSKTSLYEYNVANLDEPSHTMKNQASTDRTVDSNMVKDASVNELTHNEDGFVENNNERILDLYKEGKSILDISRQLELGQGEVRLVIDLYNK